MNKKRVEMDELRVRHFLNGDVKNKPETNPGKRFPSPLKSGPRAKRAKNREANKQLIGLYSTTGSLTSTSVSPTPSSSKSVTTSTIIQPPLSVADVGEQLVSDYQVHELPNNVDDASSTLPTNGLQSSSLQTVPLVNAALLARIEYLEAQNTSRNECPPTFRIDQVKHDDRLVRFYTGFITYRIFLAFFNFLGPVVNNLQYWGSKEGARVRNRKRKLDPENQLFLALVKLRLNLMTKDLAFRFGLSTAQVSRYLTTWICFLYHHIKELDWMPSVQQVAGTLSCVFKEKFPNTFAIIDGSEIFIETPTDLQMQLSTWSQYKHHNTAKFLIACTPNGAVSYVSPLYVGSISDVELTRISGFLTKLEDKPGISIMAD
eukprot:Em0018g408a